MAVVDIKPKAQPEPNSGYYQSQPGTSDEVLTRVGPNTPAGEYLRRYWQPVALVSDIGELPTPLRILGEDLVLFRDLSGRIGLVHKNCPHRRASLEYGKCETRGIRCCYHGWLFGVDGAVLEVPGQPDGIEDRVKKAVTLGAYPTHEYKGIVFAYLGPPEKQPAFPVYDTFEIPDQIMRPYKAPFNCNWLQVLDAILDPIHTAFLHSRISREQFSEGFGEIGEMEFFDRFMSHLGVATRRVEDNIWVRVNELVLPNFTQAGAAFAADGTTPRYFGRTAFSRWVVPIDDEKTVCIAWANFGDRGDPVEYDTPEGPELIEQGEVFDRTPEQRQRYPADAEATEGMGKITEHSKEYLVPSDKGIVTYRRKLRKTIKALQDGTEPPHVTDGRNHTIPTYGGDTVLAIKQDADDDAALLRKVGRQAMDIQFDAENLHGDERDKAVISKLKEIENAVSP